MIDKLLDYYQRELTFLRELGSEFAQQHPKIAGRLRLDADAIEDPHVSRFVEASALLAARTRLKIDDEFPDICQAILQTLYPHYLSPTPPATIVQLTLSDKSSENLEGYVVSRGARLESESIEGEPCRFRTCFDTRLWPLQLSEVEYLVPPLPLAASPWNREVQAAIRLRLAPASPKIELHRQKLDKLRLFLGGSTACSNDLVEALFGHVLGFALSDGQDKIRWLSKDCLQPVGYGDEESLLPHNPRGLAAYRILSEFFAANDKFRFADIDLQDVWQQSTSAGSAELIIFLGRMHPVLQRELDADALRIGCTPAVNLFFKRAEPIRLTDNVVEYRVIPSARSPASAEVFSIDRVTAVSSSGEERPFLPFFHPHHPPNSTYAQRYWSAKRVRAIGKTSDDDRGSEVYLSVVDLQGQPATEEGWTLDVECTCLNRDRVARLPFGGGQPRLHLVEGGAAVQVQCITPPTPTLRPMDRDDLHWRLVSHLSLNHLVLTNSELGADALREILRLYNADDSAESRKVIEAVLQVNYQRGVARVPGGRAPGFCRGVEVELLLDGERLGGTGVYLFASVLERFMGLFATLNSYTRTT
ncbi:MAG: type VI secretion system baseplate subunit TssF, partial [Planctomycetales bacterium]|nr:type VI secretion system baseplate subunit TssF [Planctomycetales bacterium]